MTEEIKQWKETLDAPMDYYLEALVSETEREHIDFTYNNMFEKIIERQKLLNAYRQENTITKQINDDLRETLRRYSNYVKHIICHSNDSVFVEEGLTLLQETGYVATNQEVTL